MTAFRQFLIVTLSLSMIVGWVHSADTTDDITEVFEYSFEDVDPIKIYAGPVIFSHAGHVREYGLSCVDCHHTLESEDAEAEEHCQDCHGEPGFVRGKQAEGMDEEELIEHYLNALHAQCINCHLEKKIEDRKRKIPVGCTQCHDRSSLPAPK